MKPCLAVWNKIIQFCICFLCGWLWLASSERAPTKAPGDALKISLIISVDSFHGVENKASQVTSLWPLVSYLQVKTFPQAVCHLRALHHNNQQKWPAFKIWYLDNLIFEHFKSAIYPEFLKPASKVPATVNLNGFPPEFTDPILVLQSCSWPSLHSQ